MSDREEKKLSPKGQDDADAKQQPHKSTPAKPESGKEDDTISLLDLIRDTSGIDEPGTPAGEETAEIPKPLVIVPPEVVVPPEEDDPTITLSGEASPKTTPATEPSPLPIAREGLQTPTERPLVHDPEATEVQPRVAFPGRQTDISAAGARTEVLEPHAGATAPHGVRRGTIREAQQQPVQTTLPASGRSWSGCIVRLFLFALIAGVVVLMLSLAGATMGYTAIARTLPPPSELSSRVSSFETVRIFDRNGALLYSQADPNTGNRLYIPLDRISPHLINATIATEDSRFYQNPGFDVFGIARAIMQAAREGESIAGTSTITQQLVRAVFLEDDERTERSFRRKVREIILAAEIARTYEKEEILELYLNEIYYGNLAYGIEAAAQTYFDKPAAELDLAEASLLAGLPQAPALWDPYSAPEKALGRQSEVLSLMIADEYISVEEARAAQDEANHLLATMSPPTVSIRHPHFTLTVLQQAEDLLGAQSIYRGGLQIYTTLDPETQRLAETTVADYRGQINAAGANNAALVALKPDTGEILALVGSADFHDEAIGGQVNMALAPRQPGSSIKPFVYLSAMERGWTPSTLIWDTPTQFPDGAGSFYEPKNYDDQFHGPLRLRLALGNSYNIPAVKALEFVGVCQFISDVQRLGLTDLLDEGCQEIGQPRDHGLSLALGGGEISPLQMAGGFATLANEGRHMPPFAIRRIEDSRSQIVFEQLAPDVASSQVVMPEHAFLLSDILSDDDARQPAFGRNSSLVIPGYEVAAKTGTSGTNRGDVRDAWTIGYTPDVVTAVWVGNTDNAPIGEGQSGTRAAAPIWNSFMSQYLSNTQPVSFNRPQGVIEKEICADSGTEPGAECFSRRQELFAASQPPLDSSHDFIQKQPIDLWTQLRANNACSEAVFDASFFTILVFGNDNILQRERNGAQLWLEQTPAGRSWAGRRNISLPLRLPPQRACDATTPRPQAEIIQPTNGSEVINVIPIQGSATGPNFAGYQLDYGLGYEPGGWGNVSGLQPFEVENGLLANWDTTRVNGSGPVTLRLLVQGPDNPFTEEYDPVYLERRALLNLLQPTATPTPTPTETPTPTPTPTATMTPSATATATIAPTLEPTFVFVTPTPTLNPGTLEPPTFTPEATFYP
ncbi:MAG: PBP1A family penicillin-binding protein [Candidatus Promineifilaceae bacterium]|nr:PBP1A family penicillin-binding protein [Candidatus Promineifilaceae bacterium]